VFNKYRNLIKIIMALGFGSLGNGITVWDNQRSEFGDYMTVAHIKTDRTVQFYTYRDGVQKGLIKATTEQQEEIKEYARTGNPKRTVTQPEPVFDTEYSIIN
jgi:sugar (pentulose or hexulose) kinase